MLICKEKQRLSRPVLSGIYAIENQCNGKVYVGSSKDIYTRWSQHRHDLKRGIHHNCLLQRAWDKYGASNFAFRILELTSIEDLLDREQYWYDALCSSKQTGGYNLSDIARGGGTRITREKLDDGRCTMTSEQFDKVVDLLCNTDLSIPLIAQRTGAPERTVYQIYFKKQYTDLTKDYMFRKRINTSARKLDEETVSQIITNLLDGASLTSTANQYSVAIETIRDIRDKITWKHMTENVVFPPLNRNNGIHSCKPVAQYTKDMEFVAEYPSARVAEKETGVGYKLISQVCIGEKKSAHGYIFRFVSTHLCQHRMGRCRNGSVQPTN